MEGKSKIKTKLRETEIGKISEEWEELRISEVCDITSSKRIFLREYVKSGIPFYRSKEIILKANNNEIVSPLFITEEKYQEIKTKFGVPQEGDILLTSVGTLGIPYCIGVNEKFYFKDGNLTWFKDYKHNLSNRFLLYWLRSPLAKRQIEMIAIGSTQRALTIDSLKKMVICIPKYDEQCRIVKIPSDLDSKIELNIQMNDTLEAIGQALFKHWFIDFEFPDEEGKPYKSSGGEMVESELGRIPKRWRVNVFSEVVGVNPKRSLPKRVLAKKISMADLIPWQSWIVHYEIVNYDSGPKFIGGDTLLARITPSLEHGKTAIVSLLEEGEVGFGSTEFIVMAPQEITSCYYIFYLARSREVRNFAIGSMTGTSGRQRVPSDCFDYLKIIVPPEGLIQKYHNIATPIFDKITANSLQTRELESIRDALLPRLMSGKIRVN